MEAGRTFTSKEETKKQMHSRTWLTNGFDVGLESFLRFPVANTNTDLTATDRINRQIRNILFTIANDIIKTSAVNVHCRVSTLSRLLVLLLRTCLIILNKKKKNIFIWSCLHNLARTQNKHRQLFYLENFSGSSSEKSSYLVIQFYKSKFKKKY